MKELFLLHLIGIRLMMKFLHFLAVENSNSVLCPMHHKFTGVMGLPLCPCKHKQILSSSVCEC